MTIVTRRGRKTGVRIPHPSFLEGRCGEIVLKKSGQVVGLFGTVHPEVLGNFDLPYPTSAAEIDLQAFL